MEPFKEINIDKYTLKLSKIDNGKGYWNSLNVEIYEGNKKLGEYIRNYHQFYDTFIPFKYKGKEYALYSRDYTSTRVMSLPDCKDLGGEVRDQWGFCPTGYYVPTVEDEDDANSSEILAKTNTESSGFGFICGCVWGDDSSWKIQYLDLSKVEEGIIKREQKFGYLELPNNLNLKQSVNIYWDYDTRLPDYIQISNPKTFMYDNGNFKQTDS